MPCDFFKNAIDSQLSQLPNDSIRERQQASINALWDVTTNMYEIEEQTDIGSDVYEKTEAWIGNVVGMTSRGMTNGDDFKSLYFKNIDKDVKKGLYYRFDDNTWITYFTDRHSSLDVDIGVRRCTNIMRIIDPENGSIFTIPCAVEYDMTAPNMQVTSSILTPNNHAKILVQGNDDTLRLFKLNTRYIISGRPFKLLAYQDALIDKTIASHTTLLYLDLFLDELHDKDDIENQLADNGDYIYTIEIDSTDMELTNGSVGSLNASVSLNGQEVNREIVWNSSDMTIVDIDDKGSYKVLGNVGDSCQITASLKNNPSVNATINFTIVSEESLEPKIIIDPFFDRIAQFDTVEFNVQVSYGGKIYSPTLSNVVVDSKYFSILKNDNIYKITGENISIEPKTVHIEVENAEPKFSAVNDFDIKVTSMLG